MADITLTLEAKPYCCEPCSQKQGVAVTELVRMIPRSVVLFGKLVGDEYWCCPICYEPKFEIKGRKPVKPRQSAAPAEPKKRKTAPIKVIEGGRQPE